MSPVRPFLRVADGPLKALIHVAGIGSSRHITPLHDVRKGTAGQRADKPGVTGSKKITVPVGRIGKPYLDADMGIRSGC